MSARISQSVWLCDGHAPLYAPTSPRLSAALLKLNFPRFARTRIAPEDLRLRHDQTEARETIYWADPNAFELLPLRSSQAISGKRCGALTESF